MRVICVFIMMEMAQRSPPFAHAQRLISVVGSCAEAGGHVLWVPAHRRRGHVLWVPAQRRGGHVLWALAQRRGGRVLWVPAQRQGA